MPLPESKCTAINAETSSGQAWKIVDLENYSTFKKFFRPKNILGKGSDGIVEAYEHHSTKEVVAVKYPRYSSEYCTDPIREEAENLRMLGEHEHIASMLTVCVDFHKRYTAIVAQLCDLGDLLTYADAFSEQQLGRDRSDSMPEVTVLKLFRDVSLALDFLHNGHNVCYVHNDLKPENILVLSPPGWKKGTDLPLEPTFKLTDFARLTPYPTPPQGQPEGWRGTIEYAPPFAEQDAPVKPSVDIWSLGCTLQYFALNIEPTESRAACTNDPRNDDVIFPDLDDDEAWAEAEFRERRRTVYRPLEATEDELHEKYDVMTELPFHEPYSRQLGLWYAMCFEIDPELRITSRQLARYAVPAFETQVRIIKEMARATQILEVAMLTEDEASGDVVESGGADVTRVPDYGGVEYHSSPRVRHISRLSLE